MEISSVFITGANRGIGLELVEQLVGLEKPPKVLFATYRTEDTIQELKDIQSRSKKCNIVLIKLDVREPADLKGARKVVEDTVGANGLNLLINNAGIARIQYFKDITAEDMILHYENNTVAPVMVLKEFLPLLHKSAQRNSGGMSVSRSAVLNMSSMTASMQDANDNKYMAVYSYRTSKAALNMAMRMAAVEVKDQGVLVVNMCPGWVRTRMGTEMGQLSTLESVSAIINTLPHLNESHHGCYVDRHGKTIAF